MAKNPNKKAKALQKDEQMNGAMKFFLAGCVAELYLLIIRRFYINADSELSRIAWYDHYLWMLAGIGAGVLAVGLIAALTAKTITGAIVISKAPPVASRNVRASESSACSAVDKSCAAPF